MFTLKRVSPPITGAIICADITDDAIKEFMKKCSKCGEVKTPEEFDPAEGSTDGRQAYCKECKNGMNKKRRDENLPFRIKHHMSSRILKQLDGNCPSNLTENLEHYLGYKIPALVKYLELELRAREHISLEEAILKRGYHVDHIHPLSKFNVTSADDPEFKACWAMKNLRAISSQENLKKGAKVLDSE